MLVGVGAGSPLCSTVGGHRDGLWSAVGLPCWTEVPLRADVRSVCAAAQLSARCVKGRGPGADPARARTDPPFDGWCWHSRLSLWTILSCLLHQIIPSGVKNFILKTSKAVKCSKMENR